MRETRTIFDIRNPPYSAVVRYYYGQGNISYSYMVMQL